MKLKVERAWAVKTWQIGVWCRMSNATLALAVMSDRWPSWLSRLAHELHWAMMDISGDRIVQAMEGSREEIDMAFEHADEDWLSPFQRMVVNERILPLPKNQLVEV